jgi:hypothetical protein
MFIKKTLLVASMLGMISLLTTISAYAETLPGGCPFYPGPYVGLDLGWARFNNHHTSSNVAGGMFLGYEFTQNFATELGYTQFPGNSHMVDLLGKLSAPVSDYVSIFGEVGPTWVRQSKTHSHGSSSSVLPEAGVGVAFLPAHNTKLRIGYDHVFGHGNVSSLNYVSAGIAYKFYM